MKRWSKEEIEEWCDFAENVVGFIDVVGGAEIIHQLLQQLEEAEKKTARECAKISETNGCICGCHKPITIGKIIRKKYGIKEGL